MRAYLGSKLTENIARSPEGYLICRNQPIARTATVTPQIYRGSEISPDIRASSVRVWRSAEVVFDRAAMASVEGKIVTAPHPPRFLTAQTTSFYNKGHVQNIRPAPDLLPDGERALLGDLVITDPDLAASVEAGTLRDCSIGYDCQYSPLPNGDFCQTAIVCNHLAIVAAGRAGSTVRIQDDAEGTMDSSRDIEKRVDILIGLAERLLGQRPAARTADNAVDLSALLEFQAVREILATRTADDAVEFAGKCNEVGRRMRGGDCRPSLTRRASDAEDTTDWATKLNARGRELRERR